MSYRRDVQEGSRHRAGAANSQTTSWGTMKGHTADNHDIAKWDPAFTKQIANAVGPVIKRWYRAEVRNLENIPPAGGALVGSTHSGGMFTPDVLIFALAFYDTFVFYRPLYSLDPYA